MNNRIGTCIMYLTDSDTIKIYWYWPNTDTDSRIGAALAIILLIQHVLQLTWRILDIS